MSNNTEPTQLTAFELERHISIAQAAAQKGISPDTFRRHYGHPIRQASPRRQTVKVRELLAADEQKAAASG